MSTDENAKNISTSKQNQETPQDLNFIKESDEEHSKISNNNGSKDDNLKLTDSEASKKSDNKLKKSSHPTEENKNVTTESFHLGNKTNSSRAQSNQNRRYVTDENSNLDENKNDKKINKDDFLDGKNEKGEFESTGKFMQINPHFAIFSKQIDSLRDSIYDDTKKCLLLKGSLQQSSNFLKNESDDLIKDIVEKIYDLRELFEKGNKGLNQTANEVQQGLNKLRDVQAKARKEIIECDKRINECENQIGYKLLGNPSYSFIKDQQKNLTSIK